MANHLRDGKENMRNVPNRIHERGVSKLASLPSLQHQGETEDAITCAMRGVAADYGRAEANCACLAALASSFSFRATACSVRPRIERA